MRGFYSRIHDLGTDTGEWLAQYFQTTLERDVRDLTQVGDLEASALRPAVRGPGRRPAPRKTPHI